MFQSVFPGCTTEDLLPCQDQISVRPNVLCCNESSVCVEFDGLSIGDMARYTTSSAYCIETELQHVVRVCSENEGWEGAAPAISRGDYKCYSNISVTLAHLNVVIVQLYLIWRIVGSSH